MEGPVSGPQDRHGVVAPRFLRTGDDGRYPSTGVGFSSGRGMSTGRGSGITIRLPPVCQRGPLALQRGRGPRCGAGSGTARSCDAIGSSQLVYVWLIAAALSPRRRKARAHQPAVPPGRHGLDGTGSRQPGRLLVRGPDVRHRVGLIECTGLLQDAVRSSASSAAARDGPSLQCRSDVSLNVWRQPAAGTA